MLTIKHTGLKLNRIRFKERYHEISSNLQSRRDLWIDAFADHNAAIAADSDEPPSPRDVQLGATGEVVYFIYDYAGLSGSLGSRKLSTSILPAATRPSGDDEQSPLYDFDAYLEKFVGGVEHLVDEP